MVLIVIETQSHKGSHARRIEDMQNVEEQSVTTIIPDRLLKKLCLKIISDRQFKILCFNSSFALEWITISLLCICLAYQRIWLGWRVMQSLVVCIVITVARTPGQDYGTVYCSHIQHFFSGFTEIRHHIT